MSFLAVEHITLTLIFLSLGALSQTLSGFGFGLIVVGGFTLFDLLPLTSTAFLVSVLGFINCAGALFKAIHQVNKQVMLTLLLSMTPAMALGFYLLEFLSIEFEVWLKVVLGLSILACCLSMLLKNHQHEYQSKQSHFAIAGGLGGILGGLFAISGPPLVYLCYRQPWTLVTLRSTLLAVFGITALLRIGMVGFGTWPDHKTLATLAIALPVVLIMTSLGNKLAKLVSMRMVRGLAIILLTISGCSLLYTNGIRLVSGS
ncbi:sulfite exporter TauE/SafE family protein [Gayadomonas joobiniege]|uniref:sulfite exporter TauE/SafE family protein n=1 Tax=Gayadomonas joobiniege TaxID=1234606 RepID=UPI00036D89BC|nr:sulfite exporter TauE/SafE family protein [Gayadomonas joobiniege]